MDQKIGFNIKRFFTWRKHFSKNYDTFKLEDRNTSYNKTLLKIIFEKFLPQCPAKVSSSGNLTLPFEEGTRHSSKFDIQFYVKKVLRLFNIV
jgi:hypothetical protein